MNITWYGHACFKIESRDGSIILDPYSDGSVYGLKMPKTHASRVHCSHGHSDHNAAELIMLNRSICAMGISTLPCFHDEVQGKKRGDNLICLLDTENTRIAHLGDIGHEPDEELYGKLCGIDILMIPVGGKYTVDAEAAKRICDRLSPAVIIPMHYRGKRAGLRDIAPVDDFLRLFPQDMIVQLDSFELDPTLLRTPCIAVFPEL